MNYIGYLDYPAIPNSVLLSVSNVISKPETDRPDQNSYFKPKYSNADLRTWCKQNILSDFLRVNYFVIPKDLPQHKDRNNRMIAFNYILDPGGSNVVTNIYDDDQTTLLDSVCIEPFRWHYIVTGKFHSVVGIEHTRVSVSITPTLEEQLRLLGGS